MILGLVIYTTQPSMWTAILCAVFGILLVAIFMAFGLFYIKNKADKKIMEQDEYTYCHLKPSKEENEKKRHGKRKRPSENQ